VTAPEISPIQGERPLSTTDFEHDIADQADALRAFAASTTSATAAEPAEPGTPPYERIVLTGMGSSHFAALPTWRRLVEHGLPAWWVDAGQLLDAPHLVTGRTLLIATSQSGASGEIVALLESGVKPASLTAITKDESSPLAKAADRLIALHSGGEATVSTKSYINTLAAHDRLAAALLGRPGDPISAAVTAIEQFDGADALTPVAADLVRAENPRLAYIGFGDHGASALYAGLITKEGAKVPAEGYVGGQFRHGPFELAGPGLTAVLFGAPDPAGNRQLARIGADLLAAGSTVVAAAGLDLPGATVHLPPPAAGLTAQLAHGALVAQHLTVAIARARGITPGAFAYGSKITTAL
jgi:glucosamine--fructose-6-phosphate aminotransferase (isomerizing)